MSGGRRKDTFPADEGPEQRYEILILASALCFAVAALSFLARTYVTSNYAAARRWPYQQHLLVAMLVAGALAIVLRLWAGGWSWRESVLLELLKHPLVIVGLIGGAVGLLSLVAMVLKIEIASYRYVHGSVPVATILSDLLIPLGLLLTVVAIILLAKHIRRKRRQKGNEPSHQS